MVASATSTPCSPNARDSSSAYVHTPPTVSAVIRTREPERESSTIIKCGPGSAPLSDSRGSVALAELHLVQPQRTLLLNIAEMSERAKVVVVRAFPGALVRLPPEPRIIGRAG